MNVDEIINYNNKMFCDNKIFVLKKFNDNDILLKLFRKLYIKVDETTEENINLLNYNNEFINLLNQKYIAIKKCYKMVLPENIICVQFEELEKHINFKKKINLNIIDEDYENTYYVIDIYEQIILIKIFIKILYDDSINCNVMFNEKYIDRFSNKN